MYFVCRAVYPFTVLLYTAQLYSFFVHHKQGPWSLSAYTKHFITAIRLTHEYLNEDMSCVKPLLLHPSLPVYCVCVVVIEVGNPLLQLVATLALLYTEVEQVNVGIQ